MATYTENYNLAKPESSDYYNHQLYDNSNMDIIDEALKENKSALVSKATDVFNGTVHTITRINTDTPMFWFVADYKWDDAYTMVVDGTQVTVRTVEGATPEDEAFILGSRVLCLLDENIVTIFTNKEELDGITADISALQTTVDANTNDINSLQTNVSTNTSDITALQTSVSSNTSNISTLQTNVAANTGDIFTLNNTVTDIDSRTTNNTNNIATNTEDIATIASVTSKIKTYRYIYTDVPANEIRTIDFSHQTSLHAINCILIGFRLTWLIDGVEIQTVSTPYTKNCDGSTQYQETYPQFLACSPNLGSGQNYFKFANPFPDYEDVQLDLIVYELE